MTRKLKTFALLHPGELALFAMLLVMILNYAPGVVLKGVLVVGIIITAAACQKKIGAC